MAASTAVSATLSAFGKESGAAVEATGPVACALQAEARRAISSRVGGEGRLRLSLLGQSVPFELEVRNTQRTFAYLLATFAYLRTTVSSMTMFLWGETSMQS